MASHSAKSAGARSPQPGVGASSSTAPGSTPEPRPNPGSKPNVLLGGSLSPVTAEARQAMIAEAAYYIAERRGFGSGREVEDWLLAEKQIDAVVCA